MKLENTFDFFILFIIFIKIIFIVSAIGHIILTHAHNIFIVDKLDPKLVYWKERTEIIFNISMALLLIYHFRPNVSVPINKETILLFYLFGWVILLTSNWSLFIYNSPWNKKNSYLV
jgi:hypothetical protein